MLQHAQDGLELSAGQHGTGSHPYILGQLSCLLLHVQETLERKRQEAMHREEQRWQQIEAERQAEEARMQHVRNMGLKGKTNHSSEHFNIISLDYHHTAEGDRLRFKVSGFSNSSMLR